MAIRRAQGRADRGRRTASPGPAVLGAVVALLALGGCTYPFTTTPSALSGFEAISIVGTDKTLGDHALSLYSGKNCSTVRTNNDLTYCEEDEPLPRKTAYCYRSLGSITCYDRPDPYKGDYVEVEQRIDPRLKRPR